MYVKQLLINLAFISVSCNNSTNATKHIPKTQEVQMEISNPYPTIAAIPLPDGFHRDINDTGTFADWLRHVDLKKDKTVYKFDGTLKANQTAQFAVLDFTVGNKDLQQCADAVMRLRAEYLFAEKKFDEIIFRDNDGTAYQFKEPFTAKNFQTYLQRVFGMCGSASLSKQLKNIAVKDIKAGDVFIRGGFPGHAEIVMDVAVNNEGKKIYLLAQSYMPAQDIHVLINPNDTALSPWYMVNDDEYINTPEYSFTKEELKRW